MDAVTGLITTYAGTGTVGFSPEWGHRTAVLMNKPAAPALDDLGNLFCVDSANHRVRHRNSRLHGI